jgi:enoyl-CoA hydratase
MRNDTIIYQKVGAVGIIRINRPSVDNAINMRLTEELTVTCAEINRDDEVKAAIVTGVGDRAFSIGLDLKEFSSVVFCEQGIKLLSAVVPVASLTIPVIAAINGDACGEGLELALACDLRIAAETAHFTSAYVAHGRMPWNGATQRLPRLIGRAKAMEMLFTGQSVDATEAHQIGLVNKVVSQRELMPAATDMAQTIASKAPFAVKYAKEAIYKGLDLTLEQGLRLEADLYFLLQTTEDRAEGIRAFLEKRMPQFKGK